MMWTRKELLGGLVLGVALGGSAFWLTRDEVPPSPAFQPAPQIDPANTRVEPTPFQVAQPETQVTEPPEVIETATRPAEDTPREELRPETKAAEPPRAKKPKDEKPVQRTPTPEKPQPREKGGLSVYTQPWSNVWVDGVFQGVTPLELDLTVGRHEVVLRHDDQEKTWAVTITAGNTERLTHSW